MSISTAPSTAPIGGFFEEKMAFEFKTVVSLPIAVIYCHSQAA